MMHLHYYVSVFPLGHLARKSAKNVLLVCSHSAIYLSFTASPHRESVKTSSGNKSKVGWLRFSFTQPFHSLQIKRRW